MTFQPNVDDHLILDGVTYRIAEHPVAPGMPYGQEGRQAVVYQLTAGDDRRALKVFKPIYQKPALVLLTDRLAAFADLSGLQVCQRAIITTQQHAALVRTYPELIFAVLMPWIDGPTWFEVTDQKHKLTADQSRQLASGLASVLAGMERSGVAHNDLSGPNVLLPIFATSPSAATLSVSTIQLVDVEQIYSASLTRPEAIPSGSPGYAHKMAAQGLWSAEADRFAGAVLIAEMLGWCDERVRRAAYGEQYFEPDELQQNTERYRLLATALKEHWGEDIARSFARAWQSRHLADCPSLGEWAAHLHVKPGEQAIHIEHTRVSPETLIRQAQNYLTSNDYDRALALAEEAYCLTPTEASSVLAHALAANGAVLEKASKIGNALAGYRRALQLTAPDSPFHRELSLVVGQVEKRLAQIAEIKSLVQQASQFEAASQWRQAMAVYVELTKRKTTMEQLPEWQEAWTRCREEVELANLFDKGYAAVESGQLNAAEELLTEVVRRRPRYEQNGKQAATVLAQAIMRSKARPTKWTRQEQLIIAMLTVSVFLIVSLGAWFIMSGIGQNVPSGLGTSSAAQTPVAGLDVLLVTLTVAPSGTPSPTALASSTLLPTNTSAPLTFVSTAKPSPTSRPVLPASTLPPTSAPPPTVAPALTASAKNAPVCPGAPTVSLFTASPNIIGTGDSVTLSWSGITNSGSVSIDNGIGSVATSGTRAVSPSNTTSYQLTAAGCGGTTSKQVTVVVMCPTPAIGLFSASPSTINAGNSSTLSWTGIFNASSISIDNGIGTISASGSRTVSPSSTTNYVITARGCGATVTKRTSVSVVISPTPTATQGISGGGLNLNGYCQSKGYAGVTLVYSNTPYGWQCRDTSGNFFNMDLFDACRWQYGGGTPRIRDVTDPYSWYCSPN